MSSRKRVRSVVCDDVEMIQLMKSWARTQWQDAMKNDGCSIPEGMINRVILRLQAIRDHDPSHLTQLETLLREMQVESGSKYRIDSQVLFAHLIVNGFIEAPPESPDYIRVLPKCSIDARPNYLVLYPAECDSPTRSPCLSNDFLLVMRKILVYLNSLNFEFIPTPEFLRALDDCCYVGGPCDARQILTYFEETAQIYINKATLSIGRLDLVNNFNENRHWMSTPSIK